MGWLLLELINRFGEKKQLWIEGDIIE